MDGMTEVGALSAEAEALDQLLGEADWVRKDDDEAVRDILARAAIAGLNALQMQRLREALRQSSKFTAGSLKAVEAEIQGSLGRRAKAAPDDASKAATLWRPDATPHGEPVSTAEAFSDVRSLIGRFVHMPPTALTLAAGLVMTSYLASVLDFVPYAHVNSPQKRCGKSTLLKLMSGVSHRALIVSSTSAAGIYRAIDGSNATLFVDEVDRLRKSDAWAVVGGIVNAGNDRDTARVLRVGGENRDEPEMIDAFGIKIFAGIGDLEDTLTDRCIDLHLERRPRDVRLDRLRSRQMKEPMAMVRSCLERWAADIGRQKVPGLLDDARTRLEALADRMGCENDRLLDVLEPIFAIGLTDEAGTVGRELATAAEALMRTDGEAAVNDGDELLADIARVLADIRRRADAGLHTPGAHVVTAPRTIEQGEGKYHRVKAGSVRITPIALAEALVLLEDARWSTFNRGKPLTPHALKKLLQGFRIKTTDVRVSPLPDQGPAPDKLVVKQGYKSEMLEEAIARYGRQPAVRDGAEGAEP